VPAAAERMKQPLVLAAILAIACLSASCRARSDKDAVAAVLDDMAARVEDRDAAGLVAHLAEDYADFEGRDRIATQTMAEEYFRRYRGIKTKVLSSRIAMAAAGKATAEMDVSLYSGVAAALRKAVGFSGENYRVSCVLRKEGRWRVSEARWEFIPMSGLFPESIKVLQELFPKQ
jgi:ketosteroid isomerase-like protein